MDKENKAPFTIHVDPILEEVVGPCGLWQWSIAVLLTVSTASLATFPVFANSYSAHRCRMEDWIEEYIIAQNLTFDDVAGQIGPWYTSREMSVGLPEKDFGCARFRLNWSAIDPVDYFSPNNFSSPTPKEIEKCPLGYVHKESSIHYPGNVMIDFETLCDKSWLAPLGTSIYMIGMLFGFILGGWSGDKFGRKPTLIGFSIFELCCGVWTCLSQNYTSYVLARFFMAIGNTAQINVSSILIIELTVARYRSILTAPFSLGVNFIHRGLMALEAYMIPEWRWLHFAVMSPNILSLLYFFYLPESPRWLLARNHPTDAIRVLQQGCRINKRKAKKIVEMEFEELAQNAADLEIQYEQEESLVNKSACKSTFIQPFSRPTLVKTIFLCFIIITGVVMSFFGLLLYASAVRTYVYLAALFNASASVPAILLSSLAYRYTNRRKPPLLITIGLSVCTLIGSGLFTVLARPQSDLVLTICSNIALVLLNSSLNMFYVYIPELFPSDVRTHAFGTILGLTRVGSILCTFTNELDRYVRHGFPLVIYSAVLLLSWFSMFLLQDTSGENLPDKTGEDTNHARMGCTQQTEEC